MKLLNPITGGVMAALCAGLGIVEGTAAGIIGDLSYSTTIQAFGEQAVPYYGESFVAPGGALQSLSFIVNTGTGVTRLHVLITETAPGGTVTRGVAVGVNPTNLVFESAPIVLPPDATFSTFTTETIDLGRLKLQPGKVYAFLLDAFVEYDGTINGAGVGTKNSDPYPGGNFFFYGGPATLTTRGAYFNDAANWFNWGDADMSFQIAFTDVLPEPPSVLCLATGLLMVVGCSVLQLCRRA